MGLDWVRNGGTGEVRTQLQSQFGLFRLRYRFRSLGRRQFICHTRQSGVVAISKWQAGNQQLTMLVIILWCPWLLRAGPESSSESESGYGYGHRKQSTCEASQRTQWPSSFRLYCSANLGAKSLDKGWPGPARTASPLLAPDAIRQSPQRKFRSKPFECVHWADIEGNPNSYTLHIALTRKRNVNQIRNWNRVNWKC